MSLSLSLTRALFSHCIIERSCSRRFTSSAECHAINLSMQAPVTKLVVSSPSRKWARWGTIVAGRRLACEVLGKPHGSGRRDEANQESQRRPQRPFSSRPAAPTCRVTVDARLPARIIGRAPLEQAESGCTAANRIFLMVGKITSSRFRVTPRKRVSERMGEESWRWG